MGTSRPRQRPKPQGAIRTPSCRVAKNLSVFPRRGTPRDDIRPGLRTTNYKGRAVIAFDVNDGAKLVSILGVFYAAGLSDSDD
jgi:plasmid stabilization system protein ParE